MKKEMKGYDYRGGYEINLLPLDIEKGIYQLQVVTAIIADGYDDDIHVNMSKEKLKELRDMIDNILNNTKP